MPLISCQDVQRHIDKLALVETFFRHGRDLLPRSRRPVTFHRRSIRLKGYDYTQPGAYFVTLVIYQRDEILGKIVDGEMQLSKAGQIVAYHWNQIPAHFPAAKLDEWVIMPNHLHGIIVLEEPRSKGEASANQLYEVSESWTADASPQQGRPIGTAPGSLGAILQNFKSVSTRKINQAKHTQSKGEASAFQINEYPEPMRADASPRQADASPPRGRPIGTAPGPDPFNGILDEPGEEAD